MALWLTAVPYGPWSKRVRELSMEEHVRWVQRLEQVLGDAIDHFGLALRDGTTLTDLAGAVASRKRPERRRNVALDSPGSDGSRVERH